MLDTKTLQTARAYRLVPGSATKAIKRGVNHATSPQAVRDHGPPTPSTPATGEPAGARAGSGAGPPAPDAKKGKQWTTAECCFWRMGLQSAASLILVAHEHGKSRENPMADIQHVASQVKFHLDVAHLRPKSLPEKAFVKGIPGCVVAPPSAL